MAKERFNQIGWALLAYFIGLVLPICIFVWWGNNLNERMPVLPFVVCIPLMAGAGWFIAPTSKQWIGWSAFIGLIEALALVFMV